MSGFPFKDNDSKSSTLDTLVRGKKKRTVWGIKTSNRFDVFADVHASAKHQPFDSDDFGDGDYRSDSETHRDSPIPGVGDHRRVRSRQLGKGGIFLQKRFPGCIF